MVAEPAAHLDPPPRPWRLASRLILLDADDRVLLLRAHDPFEVDGREWWEVPGGGVEPGEDTVAAAVREVAEETGYVVPPGLLSRRPSWHGEVTFRWARQRYWSSLVMHVGRVDRHPPRRPAGQSEEEQSCFLAVRWLPLDRIAGGSERFFPATLPTDLPRLLAGESVDAGFSVWS